MNITYKLDVVEDLVLGDLGLVTRGVKLIETPMVAAEGNLIAHDIFEHVNGLDHIGSVDDELEALGGCMYIRGYYGYMRKNSAGSVEEGLTYDIANLAEIFVRGVDMREPVPEIEYEEDASIEYMVDEGLEKCKSTLEYEIEQDFEDEDVYNEWLLRLENFKAIVKLYVYNGWQKAEQKYPNRENIACTFWNVADAVDKIIPLAEYEGQTFNLTITDDNAFCDEYYNEEFDFDEEE